MTTSAPDPPRPEARPAKPKLSDAAVALKLPHFRRFFFAALASSSGSWLQGLASPFVMFQLTESGAWVGASVFAIMLPMAIVGPLAGPLADRISRRQILLITQSILAATAFGFALLWWTGVREPTTYLAIMIVYGTVNGFNMPAWQAYVSDLVPRELLTNAITLNSAQFNAARALGPSIGGIVLAGLGPGWAFFGNAMSFLIVVMVLVSLPPTTPSGDRSESPLTQFVEGWRYARSERGIMVAYFAAGAVGLLGGTLAQVHLVLFAERVFMVGEFKFGLLVSAFGLGAIVITPWLASIGAAIPASRRLVAGIAAYGIGELVLSSTTIYAVGLLGVFIAGSAHMTMATTTNSTVQLMVDERMRGRVMSLYLVVFTLTMPLGAVIEGPLADAFGPQVVVAGMGTLLLCAAVLLTFNGRAATFDEPVAA